MPQPRTLAQTADTLGSAYSHIATAVSHLTQAESALAGDGGVTTTHLYFETRRALALAEQVETHARGAVEQARQAAAGGDFTTRRRAAFAIFRELGIDKDTEARYDFTEAATDGATYSVKRLTSRQLEQIEGRALLVQAGRISL